MKGKQPEWKMILGEKKAKMAPGPYHGREAEGGGVEKKTATQPEAV